ncbi:helix-turn-helix transcriptional regulator [Phenylobacterium sp.]|uniref:helix-turn-helix domain-containing protein n=1 Tax=Phenylobacterium sp. TaxID=1871053 RepID=UPI0025E11A66|nr:helix-turn-helix transcriptional regulator [Phenylobacterium sp.]
MAKAATKSAPHRLDVAIGQRIRERRRSLSLSQSGLAEAVGVTFQQIQKYERGANRISFSRLVEIAGALRCELGELTEGLYAKTSGDELGRLNTLLATPGALEMLEAFVALPAAHLQRAFVKYAKTFGEAGQDDAKGEEAGAR